MDLKLSHCFIAVDDHDKALAFYRDVLGLAVRNDVSFEGMRWVSLSPPSQPDVEIVLEPPSVNPNASPADKQALADLMAKGMLRAVIFATDNCDATFEHIQAAGAEVLQEPIDQPYGVRDCAFRDPYHTKRSITLGSCLNDKMSFQLIGRSSCAALSYRARLTLWHGLGGLGVWEKTAEFHRSPGAYQGHQARRHHRHT